MDTRSASAGLESVFRALLTTQPQPAWIAYTVPAARGRQFGCDSYWRDGEFTIAGGTVHLEPPSEALVLYRVDANQIGKIRTLAPDCDIDARRRAGALADRRSAGGQRRAALDLRHRPGTRRGLGHERHRECTPTRRRTQRWNVSSQPAQPESVRQKAVSWLPATHGSRGFEALKKILANDPSDRVRERAMQTLARSREPEAIDLVTAAARNDRSPRVRGQALSRLPGTQE